jgi:PAS domain S-box-containing protein
LRDNEFEIYSNIIDNAKDIILIMTSDGKIVDANKEAVGTYGYTYDELIQMDIFQLRDPNRVELVKEQFVKAKAEGIEFEAVHYKKDGKYFPVEVKSIGVKDNNGSEYIVSLIRDITFRRKKEEEIIKLASIVESSDDAIMGITLGGFINSWNNGAENLFGYTRKEILGKSVSILIPEESNDDILEIINRVRNKDKVHHYEATRKTKDGRSIQLFITISPIYNFEGTFMGISAIARDMTEINTLTQKIREHENRWRLANELLIASTFQATLMPASKHYESAEMYGKFLPSSMVGGDLYDCAMIGDSLWFIIADVMGHGLVAAMVSTMVKGLFNDLIRNYEYPDEILKNMNSMLLDVTGDYEKQLVSAFVGVIRNNTLYFSNAGHPYPILIDVENGTVTGLEQNGFLLSMQRKAEYEVKQMHICEKDMILMYTDGIFDRTKNDPMTFGNEIGRLALQNMRLLKEDPHSCIEKLIYTIHKQNGSDFEDDVSIMLIKMTKNESVLTEHCGIMNHSRM